MRERPLRFGFPSHTNVKPITGESSRILHYFTVAEGFRSEGGRAAESRRVHEEEGLVGVVPQDCRYCKAVKATQPAMVVTGAPAGPATQRITPSSVEQKPRTPVWFAAAGEPPMT
jgi:hypothetical protein